VKGGRVWRVRGFVDVGRVIPKDYAHTMTAMRKTEKMQWRRQDQRKRLYGAVQKKKLFFSRENKGGKERGEARGKLPVQVYKLQVTTRRWEVKAGRPLRESGGEKKGLHFWEKPPTKQRDRATWKTGRNDEKKWEATLGRKNKRNCQYGGKGKRANELSRSKKFTGITGNPRKKGGNWKKKSEGGGINMKRGENGGNIQKRERAPSKQTLQQKKKITKRRISKEVEPKKATIHGRGKEKRDCTKHKKNEGWSIQTGGKWRAENTSYRPAEGVRGKKVQEGEHLHEIRKRTKEESKQWKDPGNKKSQWSNVLPAGADLKSWRGVLEKETSKEQPIRGKHQRKKGGEEISDVQTLRIKRKIRWANKNWWRKRVRGVNFIQILCGKAELN